MNIIPKIYVKKQISKVITLSILALNFGNQWHLKHVPIKNLIKAHHYEYLSTIKLHWATFLEIIKIDSTIPGIWSS